MAINLQVQHLTKSFGERTLFEDISFTLEEGDRVGLIAANGSGKTTLLNIIDGREDYQAGEITLRRDARIGYLEQDPVFPEGITVLEACFSDDNEVVRTIVEYEKTLASGDHTSLDSLTARMDILGAWDYEQRIKQILSELKITQLDQPVAQLSGGQAKRVALANTLITEPDILMLDEPTNHLDMDMTEWLEGYLVSRRMSLLMVTHDRYFLDRVCDRIVEIDNQQIYTYKGNYSYYLEKRQERVENMTAEAEKTRNLYRRELDWIRRTPSARTGKAKYRIDAFEELSGKSRRIDAQEKVKLDIKASYIGKKILESERVNKSFGDMVILRDFSYTFARFEKLGITGDNGTGKSTFIKILLGQTAPDSGVIDIGETVKFGYYSQDGMEFDENMKVIDVITAISEDIAMSDGRRLSASQFLGQFLFTPKTQHNYVYKLSGGEKRRLYLCSILIGNPNFLILDEPTNDLDIQTLNVLEEYLASYGGCLIVVSHDRYFMDKVTDHLFVFMGGGEIKDFPGSYTQYREWRLQNEAEKAGKQAEKPKPVQNKAERQRRLSFNEKREFEGLESQIPELESRKNELETRMSSGTMTTDELIAAGLLIAGMIEEIDTKTMRWLELSEIAEG